ncbi:MAG: winged helix-turn-helix transcriptional regulator [Candidatus Delongbacteria bacterium]|nr:winged helix-turn-helix transcriptional regulator [Candidatus Delongbacteria bacterium]MBN2836592.1 winged helix-turn-helix transcriptional regulator [Candidatus Delongbacteria bacterium]
MEIKPVNKEEKTDSEFGYFSKILKILGNPLRLKIIYALYIKKCRVGKLTECIDEKLPIISQQIAILRKEGIITGERDKNVINYKISDKFTDEILKLISNLPENFLEKL